MAESMSAAESSSPRRCCRGAGGWALLLLLTGVSHPSVRAEPLSPTAGGDDPRLARTVTVRSPCIMMGELLERMKAQTGVDLSVASPPDGAGDEVLLVNLRSVSLFDAMDALWSLVSYRGAEWHWARTASSTGYSYSLSRPTAARSMGATLRAEQEKRFVAETTARILAATGALTQDEFRRDLGRALGVDAPSSADGYPLSSHAAGALRVMGESLSGDQIEAVLRGASTAAVQVSDMNSAGRGFVDDLYSAVNPRIKGEDGEWRAAPRPNAIRYSIRSREGDAPCLMVGCDALGETGFSGGMPLQRAMVKAATARWILPNDTRERRLDPWRLPAGISAYDRPDTVGERLLQVADLAGIPMLMRCPMPAMPDVVTTAGETLAEILARLEAAPTRFAHKWRGHALLVEWFGWWAHEERHVPWATVKAMRAACGANSNRLPIDTAMKVAPQLTPEQVWWNLPLLPGGDMLLRRHDLLASLAPYRAALMAGSGCPVDGPLSADLAPYLAGRYASASGGPWRVRLLRERLRPGPAGHWGHELQLQLPSGNWAAILNLVEPEWKASTEHPPVSGNQSTVPGSAH